MKREWLVTNEISAESSARSERGIFGVVLVDSWQIQATFVVGE